MEKARRRSVNADLSDYHKRKPSAGIDKRSLRAHRRSLEWKSFRADDFNKRRDLGDLSPLKEVDQNFPAVQETKSLKPISKSEQTRRDKLQKWKEEKELKRKLDAQKNKKQVFKVAKVKHQYDPFKPLPGAAVKSKPAVVSKVEKTNVTKPSTTVKKVAATNTKTGPKNDGSNAKVLGPPPRNNAKQPGGPNTRGTGKKQTSGVQPAKVPNKNQNSGAKSSKPEQVDKIKDQPGASAANTRARTTRSTVGKMGVASAVSAPTSKNPKKESAKQVKKSGIESKNKKPQKPDADENVMPDKVTSERGNDLSFAPTTFKFSAPENVQSFVFKPLSPASAARFLISSPKTSSSRCSTPKQSGRSKVPTPSEAIEGYEVEPIAFNKTRVQGPSKLAITAVKSNSSPVPNTGKVEMLHKGSPEEQVEAVMVKKEPEEAVKQVDFVKAIPDIQILDMKQDAVKDASTNSVETLEKNVVEGSSGTTAAILDSNMASSEKENSNAGVQDHAPVEFRTPGAVLRAVSRRRGRSLGTALTNSAKRKTPKNNRTSLILRTLSPEEGVEVLKNSPMIELDRRTPKYQRRISAMPNFDDLNDDSVFLSNSCSQATDGNKSDSELMQPELVSDTRPTALSDPLPCLVEEEEQPCTQPDLSTSIKSAPSVDPVPPSPAQTDITAVKQAGAELVHDIPFFRSLLTSETDRINQLCSKWDSVIESASDIGEEALGEARATIGKANLLIAQRFKQFSDLVDKSEFNTGEKAIHCSDLDGFWEMVYFQVEDINEKFKELEQMHANNWHFEKPVVTKTKKLVKKKPVTSKASTKPAGKSKFAAFRAKMKQQAEIVTTPVKEAPSIMIESAENTKTFEGGFFAINSPVKSPKVHCEDGTPNKLQPGSGARTPQSGSPLVRTVLEKSARNAKKRTLLLEAVSNVLNQSPPKTNGSPMGEYEPPISCSSPQLRRRRHSEVPIPSESQTSRSCRRRRSELVTPGDRKRRRSSRLASLNCEEPAPSDLPLSLSDASSIFTPAHPVAANGIHAEPQQEVSILDASQKSLSRRPRKSVSFSSGSDSQMEMEDHDNFLTKYLQPSADPIPEEKSMEVEGAESPIEDADMAAQMKRDLSTEFECAQSAKKKRRTHASAPGGRPSSSPTSVDSPTLARCLSMSERRASRRRSRRSVHFSFCASPSNDGHNVSVKAPSTPFNRDGLVPAPRSSGRRRSTRSQGPLDDLVLFTPPCEPHSTRCTPKSDTPATKMSRLRMDITPIAKPKRVSELLFTPPQTIATLEQPSAFDDEQTLNLMSFSPLPKAGAGHL